MGIAFIIPKRFCLTRFDAPKQSSGDGLRNGIAKSLDDPAVRVAARRVGVRSVARGQLVVAALRESRARPRRNHARLLHFLFARRSARAAHRARLRQFHCARRFSFCRERRHPHRRQGRSHAVRKRRLFAHRRNHRKCPGHNRRGHAVDPPVDSHEQIPRHGASHCLFHFYRGQRRRLPYAHRRPAAVSRLPARRALLVGRKKLLADVGNRRRHFARHFLRRGQN